MARLEGETSNAIFDVFEEWEAYFKSAKIDFQAITKEGSLPIKIKQLQQPPSSPSRPRGPSR